MQWLKDSCTHTIMQQEFFCWWLENENEKFVDMDLHGVVLL